MMVGLEIHGSLPNIFKCFSRAYQTGFSRFDFLHRFLDHPSVHRSLFQWKQGGRTMPCFSSVFFSLFVSSGERRNLQRVFLPQVMARIPHHEFTVNEDRCFGCGACIALCPVHVLSLEHRMIYVDEPNCTHCRLCIPSCPVFALDLELVSFE